MTPSPDAAAGEEDSDIVMRAARVFAGVTAESIAQAGDMVTPPQLRVLVLASSQEPLNTSGVAAALDVHLSNASRILRRMTPPDRANLISGLEALNDAAGDYTVPGLD